MSFLQISFLTAMAAAAGPAVIHLLNRRRYRTKQWAAMNFLREALRRNRKAIEMRDLILLLLRTLIVIFLVLAMARPYWTTGANSVYSGEPVHAVLVIDNSLSMGYSELDPSLLDQAKQKAREFIKDLPAGSDVSIVPLCDVKKWYTRGAFATREDASEALDRIDVVDRSASLLVAAEKAAAECEDGSDIKTKRVIIFSDMQEASATGSLDDAFKDLPSVQLVAIQPTEPENTWVTDFFLRDGIADTESSAVFHGAIQYRGPQPAIRIQASLYINDVAVEEQFIDVSREQPSQVVFTHRFVSGGTSDQPVFNRAELKITADRLQDDDVRCCVVPVLTRIPVMFADQWGSQEDPDRSRYGESFPFRALLTSVDEEDGPQLVDPIHRTPDTITREDLQDARMAVIAGSAPPPDAIQDLLREYVEQGGQLLIAGGAEFDPAAWNASAWRDGEGLLPAPLSGNLLGNLPEPGAPEPNAFRLDPNTFDDPLYKLELSEEEQRDIISTPSFYLVTEVEEDALDGFAEAELDRVSALAEKTKLIEERLGQLGQQQTLSDEDKAEQARLLLESQSLQANWLNWENPLARDFSSYTPEQLVALNTPRVLGRFDNGKPFAVQRQIGKGHVYMMASGVFPVWNTVAVDSGVLIFSRVVRQLLLRSLPDRTMGPLASMVLPVPARQRGDSFEVVYPGENTGTPIGVEGVGTYRYGVVLRSPTYRGFYEIIRTAVEEQDDEPPFLLAFNGPAAESRLIYVGQEDLMGRINSENTRWVGANDTITLSGQSYVGTDSWRWLWILMMLMMAMEMWLLRQRKKVTSGTGASTALSAEGGA